MNQEQMLKEMKEEILQCRHLIDSARDEQRRFTPLVLFLTGFLGMTNLIFIVAGALIMGRFF